MNDWLPIAFAILFFAIVSGQLRRRFAPLPGERKRTSKQASVEGMWKIILVTAFLTIGFFVLAAMTGPPKDRQAQKPSPARAVPALR